MKPWQSQQSKPFLRIISSIVILCFAPLQIPPNNFYAQSEIIKPAIRNTAEAVKDSKFVTGFVLSNLTFAAPTVRPETSYKLRTIEPAEGRVAGELVTKLQEAASAAGRTPQAPGHDIGAGTLAVDGQQRVIYLRPATEVFGESSVSKLPEREIGGLAEVNEPRRAYRRLLTQDDLSDITNKLNQCGLGFLLQKYIAYTRTQLDQYRGHKFYLVRGIMKPRVYEGRRELTQEVLIPDFRADQLAAVLPEILMVIYPDDFFAFIKRDPSLRAAYQRLPLTTRTVLEEQVGKLSAVSLPPRNEDTAREIIKTGVLHEIGEAIWTVLEAKAQGERNPTAISLYNWWKKNAKTSNNGVAFVKNVLKEVADPNDTFFTNAFSDKFATFVDQNSIWIRFGETLTDEESKFFAEVIHFLQREEYDNGHGFSISAQSTFTPLTKANATTSGEAIGKSFSAGLLPEEMITHLEDSGITISPNVRKIIPIIQRYFNTIHIRAPDKTKSISSYEIEFRKNVQHYAALEENKIILDIDLLNLTLKNPEDLLPFLAFVLGHEGSHAEGLAGADEQSAQKIDQKRFAKFSPRHRQAVLNVLRQLEADKGYINSLEEAARISEAKKQEQKSHPSLLGTFSQVPVSEEGRFVFPLPWRHQLAAGEKLVLELEPKTGIIRGYCESDWIHRAQGRSARSIAQGEETHHYSIIDSSGRIELPKIFRDRLHFGNSVTVVGCGDYFEIWPAEKYESSSQTSAVYLSSPDYLPPVPPVEKQFLGEDTVTIDAKYKFLVHAQWRKLNGPQIVLQMIPGQNKIRLFSLVDFERIVRKNLPRGQEDQQAYRRAMYGSAWVVEPDGEGRVLMPHAIRESMPAGASLKLTGHKSYVEISAVSDVAAPEAAVTPPTRARGNPSVTLPKQPLAGTFRQRSFDNKGRFTVPAQLRNKRPEEHIIVFELVPGQKMIRGYFASDWDRITKQAAAKGVVKDDTTYLYSAFEVQNRVVIPRAFQDKVSFGDSVTIVARGDYFEIWPAAAYASIVDKPRPPSNNQERTEMAQRLVQHLRQTRGGKDIDLEENMRGYIEVYCQIGQHNTASVERYCAEIVRFFKDEGIYDSQFKTDQQKILELAIEILNGRIPEAPASPLRQRTAPLKKRAAPDETSVTEVKRATRICDVFRQYNVVPSYTAGIDIALDLSKPENAEIAGGLRAFDTLFAVSKVKTPHSFEVTCENVTEVRQVKSSPFYSGNCTYHPKVVNGQVINLADPLIGEAEGLIGNPESELYKIVRVLNPTYVSLHLAWSAEEIELADAVSDDRAVSPILTREILLKRVVNSLNTLQANLRAAGYNKPILIEMLGYQNTGAMEHITNPEFIKEVLKHTGAHLLVDCAHVLISAKHNGLYPPEQFMEYVKQIVNEETIGLVDEVHLAMPEAKFSGQYVDAHHPFNYTDIAAQESKEILRYIFDLRAQQNVTHPVIVNFETGIEHAQKELEALAEELEKVTSGNSAMPAGEPSDARRLLPVGQESFGAPRAEPRKIKIGIGNPYLVTAGEINQYMNHLLRSFSSLAAHGQVEVLMLGFTKEENIGFSGEKLKIEYADEKGQAASQAVTLYRGGYYANDESASNLMRQAIEDNVDVLLCHWKPTTKYDRPFGWEKAIAGLSPEQRKKIKLALIFDNTASGIESDRDVMYTPEFLKNFDIIYSFLPNQAAAIRKKYPEIADRIKLTHHGFFALGKEPSQADPRFNPKETDRPVYIGSVGKWGTYKKVEDQVAVAKKFLQRNKKANVIFLIAGGDHSEAKGYTQDKVAEYQNDPDILIIKREEIQDAISNGQIKNADDYLRWLQEKSKQSGRRIIYRPGFIDEQEWSAIMNNFDISMQLYPSGGASGPVHEVAAQGQAILVLNDADFRDIKEYEGVNLELVGPVTENPSVNPNVINEAVDKLSRLINGNGKKTGKEIRLEIARHNWEVARKMQPADLARLYYEDFTSIPAAPGEGRDQPASPTAASVSRDELLARIEIAVIPPPLDLMVDAQEHDRTMWQRFITVYDALLELLRIQGLFEGHTLLIPGSGIDAFPARVVPTIGIEREPLADAALDLAARVTGQARDVYAVNFIMHPGPIGPRYYPNVRTPHRTVLFKGMMDYVMEKRQAHFEAYLADLQDMLRVGDRILICSRADLEASATWLSQHGWQRRDDWLPPNEQARLAAALELLRTNTTNARERLMLNAHLTFFEMPEIIVVYERMPMYQTTNASPSTTAPASGLVHYPTTSPSAPGEGEDGESMLGAKLTEAFAKLQADWAAVSTNYRYPSGIPDDDTFNIPGADEILMPIIRADVEKVRKTDKQLVYVVSAGQITDIRWLLNTLSTLIPKEEYSEWTIQIVVLNGKEQSLEFAKSVITDFNFPVHAYYLKINMHDNKQVDSLEALLSKHGLLGVADGIMQNLGGSIWGNAGRSYISLLSKWIKRGSWFQIDTEYFSDIRPEDGRYIGCITDCGFKMIQRTQTGRQPLEIFIAESVPAASTPDPFSSAGASSIFYSPDRKIEEATGLIGEGSLEDARAALGEAIETLKEVTPGTHGAKAAAVARERLVRAEGMLKRISISSAPGEGNQIADGQRVVDFLTGPRTLPSRGEANVMLIFGNESAVELQQIADAAAKVYRETGVAHIVASGHNGEAEQIRDILVNEYGVSANVVLVEPNAAFAGQNVEFSSELLLAQGIIPRHVILIQSPLAMRVSAAQFVSKFKPAVPYSLYAAYTIDLARLDKETRQRTIGQALSELKKLEDGGKNGFFPPVDIPADVQTADRNSRLSSIYNKMKVLPARLNAAGMLSTRKLFEIRGGEWDWKQGDGLMLLMGLPFEGEINGNVAEIQSELRAIEADPRSLYLLKVGNLHVTAAALVPNTDGISSASGVDDTRLRKLDQLQDAVSNTGDIEVRFYYKDLTLTETGEIIALGYVGNSNLFTLRDRLRDRGISSKYTDIVHLTVGRIFDESISPEKFEQYKAFIRKMREKKDEDGNDALLGRMVIKEVKIWDQRGATNELRYGRSHSPIKLVAEPSAPGEGEGAQTAAQQKSDAANMREILDIAEGLSQNGEFPVVAMLVNNDTGEKIIGQRQNLPGITEKYDFVDHCEMVALKEAVEKGWDLSNCTLYVTMENCYQCAKAIMSNFRVSRVVVGCMDPTLKGVGMAVMKDSKIDTEVIKDGKIQKRAEDILTEYLKKHPEILHVELKQLFDQASTNPKSVLRQILDAPSWHRDYADIFDWAAYLLLKDKPRFASEDYPQICALDANRTFGESDRPSRTNVILWNKVRINPQDDRFKVVLIGDRENCIRLAREIIEQGVVTSDRLCILSDLEENPVAYNKIPEVIPDTSVLTEIDPEQGISAKDILRYQQESGGEVLFVRKSDGKFVLRRGHKSGARPKEGDLPFGHSHPGANDDPRLMMPSSSSGGDVYMARRFEVKHFLVHDKGITVFGPQSSSADLTGYGTAPDDAPRLVGKVILIPTLDVIIKPAADGKTFFIEPAPESNLNSIPIIPIKSGAFYKPGEGNSYEYTSSKAAELDRAPLPPPFEYEAPDKSGNSAPIPDPFSSTGASSIFDSPDRKIEEATGLIAAGDLEDARAALGEAIETLKEITSKTHGAKVADVARERLARAEEMLRQASPAPPSAGEQILQTHFSGADVFDSAHPSYPNSLVAELTKSGVHSNQMLILDFGCGEGGAANELNKAGFNVVGVDIDSRFLDRAKQSARDSGLNLTDNIKSSGTKSTKPYVVYKSIGSDGIIPLPDNSVDGVVLNRVMSVIINPENKDRVISEICRVLKLEGLLSLYDFLKVNADHPLANQNLQRQYAVSKEILELLSKNDKFKRMYSWTIPGDILQNDDPDIISALRFEIVGAIDDWENSQWVRSKGYTHETFVVEARYTPADFIEAFNEGLITLSFIFQHIGEQGYKKLLNTRFDIVSSEIGTIKTRKGYGSAPTINIIAQKKSPPAGDLPVGDALRTFNDTFPKYAESELNNVIVTEDRSEVTYVVNLPGDYPEIVLLLASLREKIKKANIKVIIRGVDDETLAKYDNLLNLNLNLNLTLETAPAIKSTTELSDTLTGVNSPDKYLFIARPDNPNEYADSELANLPLNDNLTLALVKKTEEILTTATGQILKAFFNREKTIVIIPKLITDKEWKEDLRSALLVLEKV